MERNFILSIYHSIDEGIFKMEDLLFFLFLLIISIEKAIILREIKFKIVINKNYYLKIVAF
jgi:hypothetical protein